MNPLSNFIDINTDFFKVNPHLKLSVFNKIPSKLMWIIAYMIEIEDNIYKNIPKEERLNFLTNEFKVTIPKNFNTLLESYEKIRLSYIERKLLNWKKKLDERDEFIANQDYNEETFEMLDKMMSTTDKLFKQYLSLESQAHNNNTVQDLAGKEASLSDKGEI